ncbi:hypothetical protein AAVH_14303 [Aphelenchoides avenae]|nr:hypothetical protein AAVH_14303 [Aphelenchus avenae]
MASVGKLSISNLTITPEFVNAINSVSSTISVNKLAFSWTGFDVEIDIFHAMVLGFRLVQDMYVHTTYANCVSDALLTGLATKGTTKFEQAGGIGRYSEEDRPRCGVGEDALLEFCFAERLSGGQKDRCVKLNYMHVYNEFFAKVIHRSKQSNRGKDVEMDISTSSRVIPVFPPELQLTPVVQGRDDEERVYNFSFVDGNPRKPEAQCALATACRSDFRGDFIGKN